MKSEATSDPGTLMRPLAVELTTVSKQLQLNAYTYRRNSSWNLVRNRLNKNTQNRDSSCKIELALSKTSKKSTCSVKTCVIDKNQKKQVAHVDNSFSYSLVSISLKKSELKNSNEDRAILKH